MQLFSSFNFVL